MITILYLENPKEFTEKLLELAKRSPVNWPDKTYMQKLKTINQNPFNFQFPTYLHTYLYPQTTLLLSLLNFIIYCQQFSKIITLTLFFHQQCEAVSVPLHPCQYY